MYTMKCKLIKPLVSTHDFSYPLSHWNRFRNSVYVYVYIYI